jgi:hypothetical protein
VDISIRTVVHCLALYFKLTKLGKILRSQAIFHFFSSLEQCMEVQIRSAKGVSNGALAVKHEKRTGERQAARGRAPTSVFRLKRVNSQQKREAATSPRD